MLDDAGLVIRRARRIPPLDAEDFEEADPDGRCDCFRIEGGYGVDANFGTIGMDVDMIAAMEEQAIEADPFGDIDVVTLGQEFGAPIEGVSMSPGTNPEAIREIMDDIASATPAERKMAALPTRPTEPRTHVNQVLHMVCQELAA